MLIEILGDVAIEKAKAEAERLSWTYKSHPIFEKEKYLLQVAKRDTLRQMVAELRVLIEEVSLKSGSKVGALLAAQTRPLRQELKRQAAEGKE